MASGLFSLAAYFSARRNFLVNELYTPLQGHRLYPSTPRTSNRSFGGSQAEGPPLLPAKVGDKRVASQIKLVAGANRVRTWINAALYSAGVPHCGATSG